jgi:four helix bundle protein
MKTIKSYQDLLVWQKSMALAVSVYLFTQQFAAEERYGITSQLRRAAVSIPSNIAEGHARNTKGEYLQQLGVASGSLAEIETQVMLSHSLGYATEEGAQIMLRQTAEVGRLLGGLLRSLSR